MKKIIGIAVVALMAVSAVHAEDKAVGNLGVGYQGIFLGDLISTLSVRAKPAPVGGQLMIGQGTITQNNNRQLELYMLKSKCFVSLVQRQNSNFYLGASLGYYYMNEGDMTGFSVAPLMGAEWNFQEIPEIGFNFEVSYEINEFDGKDGGPDAGLYGINVTTGIHYYF